MKKIRLFLSLNRETKWMFVECYYHLARARILKQFPFSKIAPSLGKQMEETTFACRSENKRVLSHISQAIHIVSRYTFWESQCLVQAIAAMKMLEKRRIESTLYLGTSKDEAGKLIAHAWLRSGPLYITGAKGMEQFTTVSIFARNVRFRRSRDERGKSSKFEEC